jgi:hypothetical protein
MNKQTVVFFFVFLTGLFCVTPCFSEQVDKGILQKMYVEYLTSEGYEAEVDGDGDVAFAIDDWSFYIIVNDDDSEYFEMLLPNVDAWGDSGVSEAKAALAASKATMSTKVAKVFVTPYNNVHIRAEIFIAKPEDFKLHFDRMVDAIITAYNTYYNEMGYGEAAD